MQLTGFGSRSGTELGAEHIGCSVTFAAWRGSPTETWPSCCCSGLEGEVVAAVKDGWASRAPTALRQFDAEAGWGAVGVEQGHDVADNGEGAVDVARAEWRRSGWQDGVRGFEGAPWRRVLGVEVVWAGLDAARATSRLAPPW